MTNSIDSKLNILVVDDDPSITNLLFNLLSENYCCKTVGSAEEALLVLLEEDFSLILSDINLSGMSGFKLIPRILASSPTTVVVMISGEQAIESAIEAMKVGAFDYLKKPFDLDHAEAVVKRAVEHHLLLESKRRYENKLEEAVRQRTEQLFFLAYHDSLTSLPNRVLFEERLSQAIAGARQNQQRAAILFFSFDRFHNIKDTLGHTFGYRLLREAAERLKKQVPEGATLARFDADEFALLLTQVDSTEDILDSVNKITDSLRLPFIIENEELFITASVGISLFPEHGSDAESLLKNAAAALHRATEYGGNNYQFYATEINAKVSRRLALENNLRRAIERSEFELYYQPKIEFNTGQIAGAEALLRWHHPESGIVSPMEFVSLAEETGLIIPIGEWVLQTACAQCKMWQDEGLAELQISVNLSASQFQQPNLLQTLTNIIGNTGLSPDSLELEVTESSIMKNAEFAAKTLRELKEWGIKIAIDDFGTGYSSLSYLKRLPLDVLKIDQSFISNVTTDRKDAALVRTIVSLAHNLKLKVVAEGVENEEQLKFLHQNRCDLWQGYFYSKPLTAADFKRILTEKLKKSVISPSLLAY